MKTVSPEFVRELIDFAPSGDVGSEGFGEMQLEGAVAAYNMLARNRIAYLAEGQPKGNQIHVLWMRDRSSTQITHLDQSPSTIRWSPDGKRIARDYFGML